MSDRRRRRRAESDEETEEVPARRRRYNTRSSARNIEAVRRPANHVSVNWSNNSPPERNSSFSIFNCPVNSVPTIDVAPVGRESQNGSSRRQEQERSTASQRATGSRGQGSSSRSGEASTSSASTSGAQRSSASSPRTPRGSRTGVPSRTRSPRPSEVRRDEESRLRIMNRRIRSYAAMSTGGRSPRSVSDGRRRREVRTGRVSGSGRMLLRFPVSTRALRPALDSASVRSRTSSGSRAHGQALQRPRTRFTSTERGRTRSDAEFSAVMRSLDLVRTREIQRRRAILRIVDFTDDRRRDLVRHDPPRPSRGSNILRSSTSTPALESATSSSRRRRSSSGRENSTIEDIIGLPSSTRPSATNRPTANVRVRESTRSADDRFTYNMTHNGTGFNIRVAFGTDEDEDSESNDPTFSLSGDSDATTFVSSISDADMSTDDVFFSDTDRVESDSGDSIESASTAASPHSLVSLSLNALHPSPTPSISSAETDGHEEEEEAADDDDDNESPTLERAIITSMRNVGNPIIFLHNNISVQLLSSMAELADAFSNIRNRLRTNVTTGNASGAGEGFRGFTPPRYNMEPARRQVPESIDCQRAKLIDELNSNTAECVICTDLILAEERVWPCKNCFNIFHLHCIRRWAKTNRNTDMGGAWICPVCRRPKFCAPNRLRYRCLCGRLQQPKPTPGVTPHCCGKKCKRKCGLLCHPGPCKMSEEETAAVSKAMSSGQGPNGDPPTGNEQAARTVSV